MKRVGALLALGIFFLFSFVGTALSGQKLETKYRAYEVRADWYQEAGDSMRQLQISCYVSHQTKPSFDVFANCYVYVYEKTPDGVKCFQGNQNVPVWVVEVDERKLDAIVNLPFISLYSCNIDVEDSEAGVTNEDYQGASVYVNLSSNSNDHRKNSKSENDKGRSKGAYSFRSNQIKRYSDAVATGWVTVSNMIGNLANGKGSGQVSVIDYKGINNW